MEDWNSLINAGNIAFDKAQWRVALSIYERALCSSKSGYDKLLAQNANRALAKVVVNYMNIAETYVKINDLAGAKEQFATCFSFLEQQMSEHRDDAAVIQASTSAYVRVRTEWLIFKKLFDPGNRAPDPPALRRISNSLSQLHYN